MFTVRLLVIPLCAHLLCAGSKVSFSGEVSHGRYYQYRLSRSLWFCLLSEPDVNGGGWRIAVERQCPSTSHDFVAVATAPIHGVNAREIEAWHFDPGSHAPGHVRRFSFVLNDNDWHRLITDLNIYHDAGKMLKEMDDLGRGSGSLVITQMQGRSWSGKSVFKSMRFRVELSIPAN